MPRLIDADALMKKEERYELDRYIDGERCYEMAVPSCAIIEAPSIDIVRCGECEYWRAYETWSECVLWAGDPYESAKTNADDYCSYGERKESE